MTGLGYDYALKVARELGLDHRVAAHVASRVAQLQERHNWRYDTRQLINHVADNIDRSLTVQEQIAIADSLLPTTYAITESEEERQFISYALNRLSELKDMEVDGLLEDRSEIEQIVQALKPYAKKYPEVAQAIKSLLAPEEPQEPQVDWREVLSAKPFTAKSVALRDYQAEALAAWRASRRGVIVLPTGAGKTYVALAASQEYLASGKPVVVLVPTRVLRAQWLAVAAKLGIPVSERVSPGKLTVYVYNTALRSSGELERAGLVVVDEAHHAHTGTQLGELVRRLSCDALGLTATVEPDSGLVLPVVYVLPAGALMGKYLAELKIHPVVIPIEPNLMEAYDRLTARLRALLAAKERSGLDKDQELELQRLSAARRAILSQSKVKLNALLRIVAAAAAQEKVFVWTESIKAANAITAALNAKGIPATLVHHKMSRRDLEAAIERFKASRVQVLVACRMLDEGVDLPDARIGVIHASGAVLRRYVQRAGRLLRPKDKPAQLYVIAARGTHEERMLEKLRSYYGYQRLL